MTPDPAILSQLSWRFLPVALLFRASNWLQGPYFYKLYSSKDCIIHDLPGGMTTLYISGYVAGLTAGTIIGSFTDRCGRRNGCVLCGLAFAFTCFTAHSDNLFILLMGRVTAGIASTLLHSAFEAWLVSEAKCVGGEDCSVSLVSSILSTQTSISSFIAIVSGAVATYSVNHFGVTGASDLSLILIIFGIILILFTWSENVGTRMEKDKSMEKIDDKVDHVYNNRSAISVLTSHPSVIALGIVQVAYEGCMHVFITLWPEILQDTVGKNVPIQFGYVFSSFMLSVMLGSSLYKQYAKRSHHSNVLACVSILLVATVALSSQLVITKGNFAATLGAFMLFEMTAGGYHPCMGSMRTRLVPSDVSASMITLFRVPQNLLVVALLFWSKEGSPSNVDEDSISDRSGDGGVSSGHARLLGTCGLVLFLSMIILIFVFGLKNEEDEKTMKDTKKKKKKIN